MSVIWELAVEREKLHLGKNTLIYMSSVFIFFHHNTVFWDDVFFFSTGQALQEPENHHSCSQRGRGLVPDLTEATYQQSC